MVQSPSARSSVTRSPSVPTLSRLRRRAIHATLFEPTTLSRAIATLGFVQADPIRAPARAQDLILRQRVEGYRAGDLERRFARLRLEEDFLYAYGFLRREDARLLHPRRDRSRPDGRHVPDALAREVLAFVQARGVTHPRDLDERFGRERAVNGWGGFSAATTRALQSLQYYGLLRVAGRRDGIRLYEAATPPAEDAALAPEERVRRLLLLTVRVLAPVPATSLTGAVRLLGRGVPGLGNLGTTIRRMLKSGELESATVEGETYLWPAGRKAAAEPEAPRAVRFLAPFDPLVWDRRRFEHLWGWPYRLEAYTKPAGRRFGYYALPLLWGERVIGWVNVSSAAGALWVEAGYVAGAPPAGRAFGNAFDAEVARLEAFLR